MKKLLLLSTLISATAFANHYDSPRIRGELGYLPVPNAQNLSLSPISTLPVPEAVVTGVVTVPTVIINSGSGVSLDVTLLDDFVDDISPNARHYPPMFPNVTAEYNALENTKVLVNWLKPYADRPNASFEVLLRMSKLTIMGRNMGMSEYTILANSYMNRALQLQPNHPEANFLYGMMLAEAGGLKEGKRYLDKAASMGYLEAEQSLIQSDLIDNGDRLQAVNKLRQLQRKHPHNAQIAKQIAIVEAGGYYIWKIENNHLSVKPVY